MASFYPPPSSTQPMPISQPHRSSNADRYNPKYQPQQFPPAGSMPSQYNPPHSSSYPPQQQLLQSSYPNDFSSQTSYNTTQNTPPQAAPTQRLHPSYAAEGPRRTPGMPPYPLDRPQDFSPHRRPSYEHKRRDSHSSRYSRDSYASDEHHERRSRHSSAAARPRRHSYLNPRRSTYEHDYKYADDRDDYRDDRRRRSQGDEVYYEPLRRQKTHRPSWGDTVTSLFSTVKRAIVEPRDKY